MHIIFSLAWAKEGASLRRAFKSVESETLFRNYAERISKFSVCRIAGGVQENQKTSGKTWVCERSGHTLTSEELSRKLAETLNQGCQKLRIVIGGADGFSAKEIEQLRPDFKWSFGPLTLSHELAALVACEQVYRAWTILKNLPYHMKH